MKLSDFAHDVYSQCGEDGIISHIFYDVLFYIDPDEPRGTEDPEPVQRDDFFAVEFGGSYDLNCSNVANLWQNKNWEALLIEADEACFNALSKIVDGHPNVEVQWRKVEPGDIDHILRGRKVDFMSIDIDGNDYHVWRRMATKPLVICIEFNPTVPYHISVHQEYNSENMMGFGSSLGALIDLGKTKGYTFLGATEINAFFVVNDLFRMFGEEWEIEYPPYDSYTYLATDFLGNAVAVGKKLPWGIHLPYEGPILAGNYFSVTEHPKQTMDAYEAKYGPIVRWPQEEMPNIADPDYTGYVPGGKVGSISARNLLRTYMEHKKPLICIAVAHVSPEQVAWVYSAASRKNYQVHATGGILALTRTEES